MKRKWIVQWTLLFMHNVYIKAYPTRRMRALFWNYNRKYCCSSSSLTCVNPLFELNGKYRGGVQPDGIDPCEYSEALLTQPGTDANNCRSRVVVFPCIMLIWQAAATGTVGVSAIIWKPCMMTIKIHLNITINRLISGRYCVHGAVIDLYTILRTTKCAAAPPLSP